MREFRQLDDVIAFAEDALRRHPAMSGAELLERLRDAVVCRAARGPGDVPALRTPGLQHR